MNIFSYRDSEINNAINIGKIKLLQPYNDLPERYKNLLFGIINEGGVEKYFRKPHVNDKLKKVINSFVK